MKKILYCILTMLIGVFCFVGCGEEEPQSEVKQEEAPKQTITVEFVENEVNISVGETKQLEVVTSKNNVFVFWSVRDKEIASVSDSGLVTAHSEGQTICYASFGDSVAICLITVTAEETTPALSVSVAHEQLDLYVGDAFDLRVAVKLGDDVVQDAIVEYDVDNTELVEVEDGKVVALGKGNAVVTITANYEDVQASFKVAVTVH